VTGYPSSIDKLNSPTNLVVINLVYEEEELEKQKKRIEEELNKGRNETE